ncbi:MAG: MBL fold metallo-hydrolase [Cyanobacteria bacterium]|nr:MBL fold metallo-hydrolase [Cyanobacteriota bacterium]MDA0866895.1 MBL fold metallo-hydrolase [Cyanobacteriota bacterium]
MTLVSEPVPAPRPPRPVLETIYAFPPNRDTMGGTSYFIVAQDQAGQPANILIDTPAWHTDTAQFIQGHGGVRWWVMTHRNGMGQVTPIQATVQCELVLQEQEAYLLPNIEGRVTFQQKMALGDIATVRWTPGYSPGSACLYYKAHGGVLFTGRHLLPNQDGQMTALRFSKTFHWPRQLSQIQRLQQDFSTDTLAYICPGANLGFLRGKTVVADAYEQLQSIDVEALRLMQPGL